MKAILDNNRLILGRNCLLYVPSPKQLEFHAGMGIYTQRACSCGTGSGKTLCGLFEDVRWALAYPGSVGYIFSPSYPMMRRNIFSILESPLLLGCAFPYTRNPLVRDFSRQDMRLDWKNGSQWWFVSLEDPEKAEGANVDYGHVDEARVIIPAPKFLTAWLTILRRLRGSGRCKVPMEPSVWITTTPDSPGTDLFNVVENPKTKSPDCRLYRWTIYDNPKLTKTYIAEIVRTHTGGFAQRFIYGRFATVGGGSFPFDSSVHVCEIDHRTLRGIRYGVDFGWTNPTAAVVTGLDADDRLWVLDEIYKSQMHTEELINELREWYSTYGAGEIMCDATSPETIENMRMAGLNAKPNQSKRQESIKELGARFLKAGDGKPRIFVSGKCVNLISELLEYKEDVKERDHAVDAVRYAMQITKWGPVDAFRFA